MRKAEISKALEVLNRMKDQNLEVSFDDMTAERTIQLAIEALVMQYDKAD
ncbi:MAG: hypothetical protein PUB46_10370 [Lachnospiraceae bacterium]|mgnify:FL=1|nr:hypothetical protein [Roseburia hominis]MCI5712145.1 hypothetical protein [Lachnospiraceae bacterium]MDD6170451.1 hypothetical protein [Lachnospiraceae bacterium]MDY4838716.1 hypothetical protein [Lachnospiraceae bacterium]